MKNRLKITLKSILTIVIVFCIVFGVIYLRLTIPSERELWRITDNNLSSPMIVGDFLLFQGDKGEFPSSCEYIYAVDENTGSAVWSSENLVDQFCDQSQGSVHTAILLISKDEDVIFVSSSYWTTDDEDVYILYALNISNGELLWKVDGYASYLYDGYYPLNYAATDTNYIYIVSKEGFLSAIDNSTSNVQWKQEIPITDYDEDILIEYFNQVVYYYSGTGTVSAYNAGNGDKNWEVSNLNDIHHIVFSDNLAYLVSWGDSLNNSQSIITALDTMTGKKVWELPLKSAPWVKIIGNKVYILSHGGEGTFDEFKTRCSLGIVNENTGCSLIVVNKNSGELVWYFNEDYLHGNIIFLVQDNLVYIGTNDNLIFALDEETGMTIWQTISSCFPYYFHLEKDNLVTVCEEKYVSVFDANSGMQKWVVDVGMEKYWYPREFILVDSSVVYVSGPASGKVYALDIETGDELWTWNHWHPRDKAYMIKALNNDILYVDQYRRFLGQDWFFALKTRP